MCSHGLTGGHRDLLSHDRRVWLDPNAGAQHVSGSLDKLLKKRQGLLILSYHERKDFDYLHVPRLAAVLAATFASPS